MSEYKFHQYYSSAYEVDPIFKSEEFEMFGNPQSFDAPILFEVDDYRYVLSKPDEMKCDEELAYKIATYLFHHPTKIGGRRITYFIGDINACKEISADFTNQVKKL